MCVSWAHLLHKRDAHGRLLWGAGSVSPPFSQLHRVGQEGVCLTHRPGLQGLEFQANKLGPLPRRNEWVPWEGLGRKALWPRGLYPICPGTPGSVALMADNGNRGLGCRSRARH